MKESKSPIGNDRAFFIGVPAVARASEAMKDHHLRNMQAESLRLIDAQRYPATDRAQPGHEPRHLRQPPYRDRLGNLETRSRRIDPLAPQQFDDQISQRHILDAGASKVACRRFQFTARRMQTVKLSQRCRDQPAIGHRHQARSALPREETRQAEPDARFRREGAAIIRSSLPPAPAEGRNGHISW